MTALPLNSVQFGSHAVASALAVQNLYASRTPNDTVQVVARLVSCTDQPSSVKIRTSFLKADTAPSEPPSAWKIVFLQPRSTAVYAELSTSHDTAAYLIEISP